MPLAVFDVTPSYAKVGDLFDTSKKYVYRDPNNGVGNPSVIKLPRGATMNNFEDRLTYSFDGQSYTINAALTVTGSIMYLGVI